MFHALPPPSAADVHDVAERTHARLVEVLDARGRSLDAPGELDEDEAVLASCYASSAADVELLGARAGQRTTKLVRAMRSVPIATERACAEVDGVNVHAEVALDGRDRPRLERLVRYVTRPPLATDRLEEHTEGRLRYAFKKAWKDGTHAVVLEPLDLIARLAAIIPPPRWHLVRYHHVLGVLVRSAHLARALRAMVLAANAAERAEVVPKKVARLPPGGEQLPLPLSTGAPTPESKPRTAEPSRHPWSWLLMRVFGADVTTCQRKGCGGRMRIVQIDALRDTRRGATEQDDISRVMFDQGIGPRGPPRPRPARTAPAGQLTFDFAG